MDRHIEEAAERIATANSVVALTGAGISAESGLATFRDPGGLWDRFDPEEIGSAGGWVAYCLTKPWDAAAFLAELRDALAEAAPNAAHHALADLERSGRLDAVITQNVDGLHREARSRTVLELHGSFARRRCAGCGRTQDVSKAELLDELDSTVLKLRTCMVHHPAHLTTRCECGSLMRADVVLFSEPVQQLGEAVERSRGADVMLVVGTSGMVYPAAELPGEAKRAGAVLVEVNPETTELSELCDLVVRGAAGDVLPSIVDALGPRSQAAV